MYNNHGVQQYRETDINSISREKMIVLLYEKMQSDLMSAKISLGENNRIEMTKKINHSQRIVSELRGALDHSIGGDISQNLESLYDFMFHEHLEVLVDLKVVHIENCLRVIAPLLDAWRQIPSGTGDNAAMDNTETQSGAEPARDEVPPGDSTPDPIPGKTSLLSVSA